MFNKAVVNHSGICTVALLLLFYELTAMVRCTEHLPQDSYDNSEIGNSLKKSHFRNAVVNGKNVIVESFKVSDDTHRSVGDVSSVDDRRSDEGFIAVSDQVASWSQPRFPVETVIVDAEFDQNYGNWTVNRTSQILFVYNYTETVNKTTAVRIRVTCSNATENYPVMFVARQQEGILSWRVPLEIGKGYSFWSVSRTLCPLDREHRQIIVKEQLIYLTVSTMAFNNRDFNLTAQLLQDFELEHARAKTFSVAASRPKYYMYTFPENVETVLLKVTSPTETCMTVSVQTVKCPVFDLDTNVEYEGKHQTMSSQAAMFLEKSDYPDMNSFYVVFITKPNNEDCEGFVEFSPLLPPGHASEVVKTVTVEVKETISDSQYDKAVFATLAVFLCFYLIAVVIGCVFAGCGLRKDIGDLTEEERDYIQALHRPLAGVLDSGTSEEQAAILAQVSESEEDNFLNRTDSPGGYGAIPTNRGASKELGPVHPRGAASNSDSSEAYVNENDIDFLTDADSEKEVFRTKTALFVSDLARKKRSKLSKLYKLYHWNLGTIAIFYGLPVAQLVLTYQKILRQTGNQDLCYYNFACAHPLGSYISSFNNVFSNIGYVLLGILFIIIVYYRSWHNRRVIEKYGDLERKYGIPQHFGLFYAMGLALVMEGIMSSCYHICPNYSNFQFDTSFMYVIACLCMLKIYQARHPDINAKAHVAYFVMAVIIFLAVVGVVYGNTGLWVVYAVVHIVLTIFLTAQIYYMGRWKVDRYIFKRFFLVIVSDCRRCSRPVYPNRFVMLLVGNVVNWAFALYGAIERPSDFASYLLAVFIGNLLLYCVFYVIMKLLSKERLSWLVIVVILTSMVTWGGSLYFFFQHLTSWQKTPAGSRAGNRECILLEFYDSHDVWHFLSAISLFFSFLILLLLDDDVSLKRRDQIPVF
ncbi:SID1 transmembrane family member 1 isoform X2 [Aplysia californica]|uniref:SID1 transmembrane family member 1 isoform X2 n=1 Tax=Aplysia californica TaxID=6500 RepID=A0ABM1AB14_APLCA|nr:SID1 transmembrane family member 1 isoform X2 [Aplysia californica]